MRVLIAYFSWTGTTRRVAETLRAETSRFAEVDLAEIQPTKQRGYWRWLALSFVPGTQVSIKPCTADLNSYDIFILGLPKWTVSCPPVNAYLATLRGCKGKNAAIFLLYGGFGEKRHLATLVRTLEKLGLSVKATLTIRRKNVDSPQTIEALRDFCDRFLRGAASQPSK